MRGAAFKAASSRQPAGRAANRLRIPWRAQAGGGAGGGAPGGGGPAVHPVCLPLGQLPAAAGGALPAGGAAVGHVPVRRVSARLRGLSRPFPERRGQRWALRACPAAVLACLVQAAAARCRPCVHRQAEPSACTAYPRLPAAPSSRTFWATRWPPSCSGVGPPCPRALQRQHLAALHACFCGGCCAGALLLTGRRAPAPRPGRAAGASSCGGWSSRN